MTLIATETQKAALPLTTMGPHLMLDCRGCDIEKISDMAYIWKVLDELPEAIGMTKITQPYVFPYSGLVPEDKGVTGFVVIAESHLAFHSFVEKDYFFFDLFSCKPMDVEAAKQYLKDAFDVKDMETHFVERGRYFPREEKVSAKDNVVSLANTGEGENFTSSFACDAATEAILNAELPKACRNVV